MAEGQRRGREQAAAVVPVPLRHNRNFRMLWTGQVLSDLGSGFGILAYPLLILALTHSPLIAGAVGTIASAVAFAVRLPAGALSDRLDRRKTLIICDGVRTVVLGALAVAVALHAIVWPVVLLVAIIDRVGDTVFTPASTAILPAIVDDGQLEGAWAATEARQYAASLGGPAVGGLLFSLGRAVPFIGDTLSYGISVLTSSQISPQSSLKTSGEEREGLWKEAFEGMRVIWHDALLRAVMIQAPLINFAFTGVIFTVTLGLQRNGSSATVIGLTQAAIMIGGLLGAIAAPRFQGRFTLSRLMALATTGGTIFLAIAAVIIPSPLVALPIAVPIFLGPMANAALIAAMLRRTPEEMRGRVNNALIQVATALAALSPLVAGILVAEASAHWAMGAFAAALGVSAVMVLSLKGLRRAEVSA
ncbi:MAG: MFS transporter [Acidimicrobiales bacterium]